MVMHSCLKTQFQNVNGSLGTVYFYFVFIYFVSIKLRRTVLWRWYGYKWICAKLQKRERKRERGSRRNSYFIYLLAIFRLYRPFQSNPINSVHKHIVALTQVWTRTRDTAQNFDRNMIVNQENLWRMHARFIYISCYQLLQLEIENME